MPTIAAAMSASPLPIHRERMQCHDDCGHPDEEAKRARDQRHEYGDWRGYRVNREVDGGEGQRNRHEQSTVPGREAARTDRASIDAPAAVTALVGHGLGSRSRVKYSAG